MVSELFAIGIVLVLAFLFGEFCKLIKVPRVLGHIFAGLILGLPLIKQQIFTQESLTLLNSLADIAVVFLFFFVGLNINLKEFKLNITESFLVSLFNFLFPLIAGFIISSGATNDVVELVFVSVILAILNTSSAYLGISTRLLNIAVFIVVLFLLRFLIFPHILGFFEKSMSNTSLFSAAIIIALITAVLSDLFGLGILIGAIFSGLIIRQILLTGKHPKPWEEHSMANSIHLISYGFLVPIFFVDAGLRTDLFSLVADFNLVLIFLAVGLLGTLGGSILGVLLSKGTFKEGLIVGFGISSRGDVEVVIAKLALQVGLFTGIMFSSIVVMAFIITLISPLMFRYLTKKYSYYLNVKH